MKREIVVVLLIACCVNQPVVKEETPSPQEIGPTQKGLNTISLDGEWELLKVRGELDIDQTRGRTWKKVQVPHYMWVEENVHNAWYRCTFEKVEAPKVVLAFDSVNFRCRVYVNNQFAGEHTGGYLPFEIDITNFMKERNELLVGVEDVASVIKKETPDLLDGAPDNVVYPVGSGFHIFGIWQSVSIKTYPSVYITDVFVRTSYRNKTIELEITVRNEDTTEKRIKIKNKIVDEFELPESEIFLKSSETKTVIVKKTWENPVLWSCENPHLYYVETSLVETQPIDTVTTRFGFREFWVENGEFYLNGIPIRMRGSSKHLLGDPWTGDHKKDAEETLKRVKQVNSNVLRLHANPYPEVFLEAADERGVLIIDESALWCLSDQYDLGSHTFWENSAAHLRDLVLRDRNHPSLVIWSVENEILLCGGTHEKDCTVELIKLGDLVRTLDPTRPIMYEGDGDLPNADIINLHYPHEYPEWTVFPNEAYFLDAPFIPDTYPRTEFFWDRKKPLYIGEFLWIADASPYPHTVFFGDEAFTDAELYRNKAKGEAWKMYIEAFRSQGVDGFCPWNVLEGGEYPTPLSEALDEVYQPFFAFVKEYSTHFFSDEDIERTLVICNDTPEQKDVTVKWESGSESDEYNLVLPPAECTEVKISFRAPHVEKMENFELSISLEYDPQDFTIEKVYEAFPREGFTLQGKIALYDPLGETRKILDENDIKYELLSSLDFTSEYDLLIVGYHSLEEEIPTVGKSYLDFSGNILVFEQETLSPFGLSLVDHSSTIVFEKTFNVDEEDLRFWREDHLVSEKDISKPDNGNYIPLLDSGGSGGLEYTPLLEYCHEKGKVTFCQLLVTEKYDEEPMAAILFGEVMNYALTAEWSPRRLGVIGDGDFLKILNVDFEPARTYETYDYDVIFVNGECDADELKAFVSEGGTAWLHGESAKVLGLTFEELQYEDLPILLVRNELTRGLGNQEFYWTGERQRFWVPLTTGIAHYTVSGKGIPLTDPCVLLKVPYGQGFFLIDTLQFENDPVKSGRIVSVLLTNLGISVRTPQAVIQAETMPIQEVDLGGREGNVYAFYTEGYLGAPVNFAENSIYTFRIYAWADMAKGEGAILEFLIDRKFKARVEVRNPGVYEVAFFVEKGTHEVGIAFTNDYYKPPEDRNLYVDKIEIYYSQSHGELGTVFNCGFFTPV